MKIKKKVIDKMTATSEGGDFCVKWTGDTDGGDTIEIKRHVDKTAYENIIFKGQFCRKNAKELINMLSALLNQTKKEAPVP